MSQETKTKKQELVEGITQKAGLSPPLSRLIQGFVGEEKKWYLYRIGTWTPIMSANDQKELEKLRDALIEFNDPILPVMGDKEFEDLVQSRYPSRPDKRSDLDDDNRRCNYARSERIKEEKKEFLIVGVKE